MAYTFPPYNPATPDEFDADARQFPKRKDARACRAYALARAIRAGYVDTAEVIWTPSRTWGATAKVVHAGETVELASGCGYDKGSAVLAGALRYLGRNDAERMMIARTEGCGYSTVRDALASCGWKLEHAHTCAGRYGSEIFTIARIAI